jgi:methyltransferase (TIGR00027 family)
MSLPDASYLVNVGQLRYIQSRCEGNPDALVGAFLSAGQRLGALLKATAFRSRLRANPFYHYVLARTRHYDALFLDAVDRGVSCIVNIGCGTDTRAYRFAPLLQGKGITVFECDQPHAIRAKRELAARRFPTAHVRYVPLDLNRSPDLQMPPGRAFVMLEGVSPYIDRQKFEAFLRALAAKLSPGSVLAYDFKRAGVGDAQRFRLPAERDAVAAWHRSLGLELKHFETSAGLTRRLLPHAAPLFEEDCLACLIC